jgi:hypothetical protein
VDRPDEMEEWAGGTTRGRHIFNYGHRMLGNELRGWEMLKSVVMETGRGVEEKVYLWQGKDDPGREMVRVAVAELPSWHLAQNRLRDVLNNSMRPDVPRATGRLAKLGDVTFVARDPQSDIPAAVSFTRGNVCVSVNSVGERNVDVSEIAARLDRALSEPPTKPEVEKGRVRTRAPKTAAVKAGEPRVLIDNLREAASRGGWLKVIAPDGELSREGDALIYVSSQGGKKDIGTYVVRGS